MYIWTRKAAVDGRVGADATGKETEGWMYKGLEVRCIL